MLAAGGSTLIVACGSTSSAPPATHTAAAPPSTHTASAQASAPTAPASDHVAPARILVHPSHLGPILVDGHGLTLYMFARDHAGRSTCTGMCARFWPPYTTKGRPVGGPGVNHSLLGVTRSAGHSIVTYRGHPLYRFVKDTRPGQITGEDVTAFGGRWDVLSPAGIQVTKHHKPAARTHTTPAPAAHTTPAPAATTPPATQTAPPAAPATTTTQAAPPPPSGGSGIPQNGGGDADGDNHGGSSDGDGNI